MQRRARGSPTLIQRRLKAWLAEALALRSTLLPPDDPRMLEVNVVLVAALRAQGKSDEAAAIEHDIAPRLAASSTPYANDLRERLAMKFSAPPAADAK